MTLPYKTKPMRHQETALEHAEREYLALFMEQGTGKTKVTIDSACILHSKGVLDTVVVAAPGGVHLNWALEELPKHSWRDHEIIVWSSNHTERRKKAIMERLREPKDGRLVWFLTNIEALRTEAGGLACGHALKRGASMMVLDESTTIKNPTALQTKAAINLGTLAKFRRILTGTPIAKSPLDLFAQFRFLHATALPYRSMTAFKADFAIQKTEKLGNRSFEKVVGYKNIDMLTALITPHSYRVLKKDCLDLPEKTYQTEPVEMPKEMAEQYRKLKDECMLELEGQERNHLITATTVVAQMTKLRQLLCGFIMDSEGCCVPMPWNPKLDRLLEIAERDDQKIVIWSVYRRSIANIVAALREQFGEDAVVEYHGGTTDHERAEAVRRFQNDPACRFFVGNRTAAKGLTLTASSLMVYYDNDMSLEVRLQSEDRVHRIGQRNVCLYIDMVIPKTLDVRVLQILRQKKQLSEEVLVKNWRDLFTEETE